MDHRMRDITFTFTREDGSVQSFTQPMAGDNEMVQWTAEQFAEVNKCNVRAQYLGEEIATAGNVEIKKLNQIVSMKMVFEAQDYADNHPHKYLRGTTNWCAAVAWHINQALAKGR